MTKITRRRLLGTAISHVTLAATASLTNIPFVGKTLAQTAPNDAPLELSDAEIIDNLLSDEEQSYGGRAEIASYWFQQTEPSRAQPVWPKDESTHDYAHLAGISATEGTFSFTADTLKEMCSKSSFAVDAAGPRILFGLRGCSIDQNYSQPPLWRSSASLTPTRPNHVDPLCTLGVWDPSNKVIAIFPGSTVPVVTLMEVHLRRRESGTNSANLMPTGLHQYVVGPHGRGRQPGAFRQKRTLWVIRANKSLSYDSGAVGLSWDDMEGALPWDNIHAATQTKKVKFSSAGCQVILGYYDKSTRQPKGSWKSFRQAAGLMDPIAYNKPNSTITSDDGRQYSYVLLTGTEAFLASKGKLEPTLRYGSSGPSCILMQEKLKSLGYYEDAVSGKVDRSTLGAFLKWQNAQGLPITGILTKSDAATMGFDI